MSIRDLRTTQTLSGTIKSYNNGNMYSEVHPSITVTEVGFSRSGVANPGWKRTIENGGNATTAYTARNLELESVSGVNATANMKPRFGKYSVRADDCQYVFGRGFKTAADVSQAVMSSIDNQARAKAYSAVSSGFNGIVALGELRETVSMIRSPAMALRSALTKYYGVASRLRSNSRTRKAFVEAIAGTWLEYSFGWKPLVADIESGFAAYARKQSDNNYRPFKATFRQTIKEGKRIFDTYSLDGTAISVPVTVLSTYECSVSYQGSARIAISSYTPSQALFGVGLPSFIPAAWELMPYSFLIDYFVNIGDLLDSWATAQYSEFSYTSKTSRVECTSVLEGIPTLGNATYTLEGTAGQAKWKSLSLSRATGGIPLPSLQVRSKLGTSQGLNIAALLAMRNADNRYHKR